MKIILPPYRLYGPNARLFWQKRAQIAREQRNSAYLHTVCGRLPMLKEAGGKYTGIEVEILY